MAITDLTKSLCGDNNVGQIFELDVAFQTSVNGATLLAGSEIDARPYSSLSIVFENITNDVTFVTYGSNDADFTHRIAVIANFAMTAGANAAQQHLLTTQGIGGTGDTSAPGAWILGFRYYKIEIFSTVGGVHGSARVRYTGRL